MNTPLNIAKVTPPRLLRILNRPRLIQRLEENQDKKLILILGQAAQGKSTLAAAYARQSKIPSAWINLGSDESDPVNLFHVLVRACDHALPKVDLTTLFNYPAFRMGPREEIPLYREWANAVFERITAPIRIVFDGLDRLSTDASSLRFLQVLLEDVPHGISLIMISRELPPLEVQRLKMGREALVLDNDELAFQPDEVKAFFREIKGISFSRQQVKKIHQSSEGWIGGLILLCEHLDRLPHDQRNGYISEISDTKFKAQVFEYFEEEIFNLQPAQVQDLLIESAIFETIDPNILQKISTTKNASKILGDLSHRNLFVVSVYDPQKGKLFRYHQLFRDFLRTKLASRLDEKARSALFCKAASLLEQKGDPEESVKCFLKAQAYLEAASVIERIGRDLLQMGRFGDLSQWLQALPEDLVQDNPWLLFYLSMTRRFTGFQENVASLSRALDLFKNQRNMSGQLLSLAHLIEASALSGRDKVPLHEVQAETLVQSISFFQHPYEKALLWIQIGFVYGLRRGNNRKSFEAHQQAYLLANDLGDITLKVNALVWSMVSLGLLGEFSQADEIRLKLEPLIVQCVYPELRILYLYFYAQNLIFQGNLEKARKICQTTREEAERLGLIFMYALTLVIDLMLNVQLNQFKKAEEIGQQLSNMAASFDDTITNLDATILLGLSFYHKGDFKKAKELIGRSRKILFSTGIRMEWHLNVTKILMVLISAHLLDDDQTELELLEALDRFEAMSEFLFMVHAHFAMALLKSKQAKTDETVSHLKAGFKIASEKKYHHFFFLGHSDSVRVCMLAIELPVKGAETYAAHLLATRFADRAGPAIERLLQHTKSKVRKKAKEIRQVIHRAGLPQIQIKTLGGFEVLRADEIDPREKVAGQSAQTTVKGHYCPGLS